MKPKPGTAATARLAAKDSEATWRRTTQRQARPRQRSRERNSPVGGRLGSAAAGCGCVGCKSAIATDESKSGLGRDMVVTGENRLPHFVGVRGKEFGWGGTWREKN